MRRIPFLLVPLILYNVIVFGGFSSAGDLVWDQTVFSLSMISGGFLTLTTGAMLILVALLFLFIEMLKSTRVGIVAVWDHTLSTFVFVAFLLEFVLVAQAATSTFVVLMAVALIDLLAGFAVSLRTATRDVSVGNGGL